MGCLFGVCFVEGRLIEKGKVEGQLVGKGCCYVHYCFVAEMAVSVFGLGGDCYWYFGRGYDEIVSVRTSD
jgi:hypothetical protein